MKFINFIFSLLSTSIVKEIQLLGFANSIEYMKGNVAAPFPKPCVGNKPPLELSFAPFQQNLLEMEWESSGERKVPFFIKIKRSGLGYEQRELSTI